MYSHFWKRCDFTVISTFFILSIENRSTTNFCICNFGYRLEVVQLSLLLSKIVQCVSPRQNEVHGLARLARLARLAWTCMDLRDLHGLVWTCVTCMDLRDLHGLT